MKYKSVKEVAAMFGFKVDDVRNKCHEVAPIVDAKQKITAVQVKALVSRCKNDGVDEAVIKNLAKVEDFKDMTIAMYANINDHWEQVVGMSKK